MTDITIDLSAFPDLPVFEAHWAAVYMEPIVQSGERLTIAVVAKAGEDVAGCLTIRDKALHCLYGAAATGMRAMMGLALERAIEHFRNPVPGGFSAGMHGVTMGNVQVGYGDDLPDVLRQACSLSSSMSDLHADEVPATNRDRNALWRKVKKVMARVDTNLAGHFDCEVPIVLRNVSINIHCDYYSSRVAMNMCAMKPGSQLARHFDRANARLCQLEQLREHEDLVEHQQRPSMLLQVPSEEEVERAFPGEAGRSFRDRQLLLQDLASKRDIPLVEVSSVEDAAQEIRAAERAAA